MGSHPQANERILNVVLSLVGYRTPGLQAHPHPKTALALRHALVDGVSDTLEGKRAAINRSVEWFAALFLRIAVAGSPNQHPAVRSEGVRLLVGAGAAVRFESTVL